MGPAASLRVFRDRCFWGVPTVLARIVVLTLVVFLAGCGGLPRPFEGRPGIAGTRLVQPPPARLVVATPTAALLPNDSATLLADSLATALAAQDIPAISARPSPGEWRLAITAEAQNGQVVPMYTIFDATGEQAGVQQGQAIAAGDWASGAPATLKAAAAAAAPGISSLLTSIDAARRASDPNSLINRPARIAVPDVTGAPGDGNRQLARNMRLQLASLGLIVQDTQPDFTLAGQVKAVPIAGGQSRIEIQWVITDATGDERGRIVQLNEVPEGSLSRFWGDVALVVAQEAAGGVKDVVARQTGSRAK